MKRSRKIPKIVLAAMLIGMVAALGPSLRKDSVLVMEIGGKVPESVRTNGLISLFEEPPVTVLDKIVCLQAAADDKKIKGVVIRFGDAAMGFGKARELRDAIENFEKKKSGKPVLACIETTTRGNIAYFLATACDRVYLSPASTVGLVGLTVFRYFLGGFWDHLYVDMQVEQMAEYKSAGDMFSRRDMSEFQREMENSILDDIYGRFVAEIARSRRVSPEEVESWIDAAWLVPEKYVEAKAVDGIKYLDEVVIEAGGGGKVSMTREKSYREESFKQAPPGAPKVAVIIGEGDIVVSDKASGPLGGNRIASDLMVKQLLKVMDDDSYKAVILRVDSGGGSVLASDLIWRATKQVAAKKPIVVSMSDVAASGGYYIACGANAVLAQPGTITGSIGVLTAMPSLGNLFRKFDIGTEAMGRGEFANIGRMDRKLSAAELSRIHDSIAASYDLFLERVGAGRNLSKEEVDRIGRGRVWTGAQAKELGLIDRLGGYEEAVAEVRKLLSLPADKEVELVVQREKINIWKILTGRLGQSAVDEVLTPDEQEVLSALRVYRSWQPGQALAVLPGPIVIQ